MADYIVNAEIHLRLTEHHEEECRQEGMSTQDIIRETLMEKFALTSDRMLSDPIVVRLVDWSVRPDGLEPENQGGTTT